ncbi:hypothetical protein HXX76_013723 [Chlamydomonas incerta]|uniref:Uncharacterized protein n=1 Tax=Chlamydomonas incerta TaxID=51695 RepID=A0A835SEI9_CHLIN|nr:hypothetical protein HXX76_013723 [Chlamydomonas incerta]|eukprot:KAG2425514.1 hypothetical protein HXX76_013723 [Chlamydomonas incerta]
MLSSLSRQAGPALARHSALRVESVTAAYGSISACGSSTLLLQTGSAVLDCRSLQSCGASYSTATVDWEQARCSGNASGTASSTAGSTAGSSSVPGAGSSSSGDRAMGRVSSTSALSHFWRRAFGCRDLTDADGWTRAEDQAGAGASVAMLVAPFTSLALRFGLGGRGGILAARRLRGEPEPFEDEQDDDEYEDGEYVDLDDEELLADLDELDEMEIDGEWDEGEWEEDRQAEEELGEGEERPGLGEERPGLGEGRKSSAAPPVPPSPRPGRDWRS